MPRGRPMPTRFVATTAAYFEGGRRSPSGDQKDFEIGFAAGDSASHLELAQERPLHLVSLKRLPYFYLSRIFPISPLSQGGHG